MRRQRGERGSALIEAAVTIPILLLISVGIFEFGHAYQTWQILTNAAREGARVAILPGGTVDAASTRAKDYMMSGGLENCTRADCGSVTVTVNRGVSLTVGTSTVSASQVTIAYPFRFIVLQPIARMVAPASTLPGAITINAQALMRNE